MTHQIRLLIRQSFLDIKKCPLKLVRFDITFKVIAALLFTPALIWIFSRFVQSTGKQVLSDFEIARYLLSPLGISSLLIIAGVLLFVNMLELAGLLHILFEEVHGRRTTITETLSRLIAKLLDILKLAGIVSLSFFLITAPLLVIGARLILPLLSEFDINYYLAERPPEFWNALKIAFPLGLIYVTIILYFYVTWTFALPILLYKKIGPIGALKESSQLVKGSRFFVVKVVLGWLFVVAAISSTLGLAGTLIGNMLLTVPQSLTVTIFFMSVIVLSQSAFAYIMSLIVITSRCALLVRLSLELGKDVIDTDIDDARMQQVRSKLIKIPRIVWGVALLCLVAGSTAFGLYKIGDLDLRAATTVIAHRGSSAAAPENTLAAIRLALEEGADFVEIDVQETADGKVVVIHDKDLKRVGGADLKVGKSTYADLKDIDIGSWFDPAFSEERLATLSEVIELCRGKARINIELKYSAEEKQLARRVIEILRALDFESDVEIMSLQYQGTQQVRTLTPSLPIGFLSNVSLGDLTNTRVDFLAVSARTATPKFIRKAQDAGKRVYVWTINTPRQMALFLDRGVDGIITDKPALLHQVISQLNELRSIERLLLRFSNQLGYSLPEDLEQ